VGGEGCPQERKYLCFSLCSCLRTLILGVRLHGHFSGLSFHCSNTENRNSWFESLWIWSCYLGFFLLDLRKRMSLAGFRCLLPGGMLGPVFPMMRTRLLKRELSHPHSGMAGPQFKNLHSPFSGCWNSWLLSTPAASFFNDQVSYSTKPDPLSSRGTRKDLISGRGHTSPTLQLAVIRCRQVLTEDHWSRTGHFQWETPVTTECLYNWSILWNTEDFTILVTYWWQVLT
jgi:hypothetical protein